MKKIGIEEVQGLFQTWPEGFKERFGRNLTKLELLETIDKRISDLEIAELKLKFSTFGYQDLCLMRNFLENNEIDKIEPLNKKDQNDNGFHLFKSKKKST